MDTLRPFGVVHVYRSIGERMKWLVSLVVVLVIVAALTPWLGRRFRRIPGDFQIPLRGRVVYIPLASTIALSLAVWLLSKLL